MHELGVIFNIIESIEKVGEENSLTTVEKVTLEVGEVSGIVPIFLTECWGWAVEKSELLKNSVLETEMIKAVTYCENCGKTYPTIEYAKICPYCKSDRTYLVTGNELNIKEITAC